MPYSASGRRDIGTPAARPFSRLLCALALTVGLVHSASTAHAQAAKASAVAAAVSQSTALEGTLEVLVEDDFKGKKSKTRHFLNTDAGERYELHFKAHEPHHPSGSKVKVTGTRSGNLVTLDSGGSGSVQVVTAAIAPNTFGAQNTLVILVNFQDQPTKQPWTAAQIQSLMFGTVSDFYLENSYRQTSFTGTVAGWFTIPINSTTCDQMGIDTYAKQAATAAGVNLAAYTRLVYMFPPIACPWSGTSTVGGNPSRAWINGEATLAVLGHELGHSMGLHHSHSWSCSDGSVIGTSTACASLEYGDKADIMGGGISAHFSAFQKEWFGWLNNGILPPITTVTQSGTYTIDPYETTGTKPKALKIFKGLDAYGYKTWYYVEYRQAIGFDSYLSSLASGMDPSNTLNGVFVHMGTPDQSGNTAYLLDMTPATYIGPYSPKDPALTVGQTFTDATAGVTITTQWVNGTNAGISVTLAGSPASCTHANPSVLLSPTTSTLVAAGTPVAYTLAVTNNDSSACSAATLNLQASLPSGWSAAFAASSLSVAPGSAASTTLTVTSAATASTGSYSVGTTATNSTNSAYVATGTAAYTVGSTTTTTTTTSKGNGKGRTK